MEAELIESSSVASEGIDSVDIDRTEDNGPRVVSLLKLAVSRSSSSGGLRRKSQVWGLEEDRARREASSLSALRRSIVSPCAGPRFRVEWALGVGPGIEVIASKAATDEGIDVASCRLGVFSLASRLFSSALLLLLLSLLRVLVGITTGLEGSDGGGARTLGAFANPPDSFFSSAFLDGVRPADALARSFSLPFLADLGVGDAYMYALGTIMVIWHATRRTQLKRQ